MVESYLEEETMVRREMRDEKGCRSGGREIEMRRDAYREETKMRRCCRSGGEASNLGEDVQISFF